MQRRKNALRLHCGILFVHREFGIVDTIAYTLALLGVYVELAVVTLAVRLALVMLYSNAVASRILSLLLLRTFTVCPWVSNVRVALKLAERVGAALASLRVADL